jgi:hypothetical protein
MGNRLLAAVLTIVVVLALVLPLVHMVIIQKNKIEQLEKEIMNR